MKNLKQLALVGLLSFGIVQADISLNIEVKKGEKYCQNLTFVVSAEDNEAAVITHESHDGRNIHVSATPAEEDSVLIEVALEGHDLTLNKTVKWGECAEFSCEEADCCLRVIAEQQ